MKIRNYIASAGLVLMGLTACSDYLDVSSPSNFYDEDVVSTLEEANRLLNNTYANLASKDMYGEAYFTTFMLNSDVDFTTGTNEIQSASRNEFKAFDGEADASNVNKLWAAAYATIESANNFVAAAQNSKLYAERDSSMLQLIGEAKCIRAMNYLDLAIMFGDIPFSLTRTYDAGSMIMPIANRDTVYSTLIRDLEATAEQMQFATDLSAGVERCSKEFCWALISRIALFRGGYSLRHDESATSKGTMKRPTDYLEYYKIARDYSKKVIDSGTHSLTKDWYQVFVDECNYKVADGDDPIFEIPFTQNVSGNIGYVHGPQNKESSAGGTEGVNQWGKSDGKVRLNAFYRFTFDPQDTRRNAVGFWLYEADGKPTIQNTYTNFSNKWSKLWDEEKRLGYQSSDKTGINFPYMRYTDVLLMFAEAENELNNGPTTEAVSALKTVRERAFRGATNAAEMVDGYVNAATSKEDFFQLIYDERAWEFASENIRWKDLVRWNLYSKVIYKAFWKYYGVGSDDDSYDFEGEYSKYPKLMYYRKVNNPGDGKYPNKTLDMLEFFADEEYGQDCLWKSFDVNYLMNHADRLPSTTGSNAWTTGQWFTWTDDNTGFAKAECRCSLRGYIYISESGILESEAPRYTSPSVLENLPPVRYILPIPSDAISRSQGEYKNYYGYK